VLFSDIAGFTTFSEKLPPEELVLVLNEYLSAMTEIVFKNDGTLDKYEGDAVMAFWGAPVELDNNALHACNAALEMQEKLVEIREKWRAEGKPNVQVRIGLNTGEMVVGNMGGIGKFDYTVIGDSVNLGSRLEGANKQYGTYIMASERTQELVKDYFVFRELDLLVVKGKTMPIKVFELLGRKDDSVPAIKISAVEQYLGGLELYRRKQFAEAIKKFNEALVIDPTDSPSSLYIERSQVYLDTPPPDDWNGVFILKRNNSSLASNSFLPKTPLRGFPDSTKFRQVIPPSTATSQRPFEPPRPTTERETRCFGEARLRRFLISSETPRRAEEGNSRNKCRRKIPSHRR